MRKTLIAAACISLLAACSQEPETPPATPEATVDAAAAAVPAPCPPADSPLPEGLTLDVPLHVAADRINVVADGKAARRITAIEFLEGTRDEIIADVKASMAGAGFDTPEEKTVERGLQLIFKKRGTRLFVAFTDTPPGGPAHPAAKGRMIVNAPYLGDLPDASTAAE